MTSGLHTGPAAGAAASKVKPAQKEKKTAVDGFLGHALSVFMGFFAIMNPIANTPVFLGLTAGDDAGN